jgi:hypothetical protein
MANLLKMPGRKAGKRVAPLSLQRFSPAFCLRSRARTDVGDWRKPLWKVALHVSLISLLALAFGLFNDALKFDPASGLESDIFIEIPLGFRIFVELQ